MKRRIKTVFAAAVPLTLFLLVPIDEPRACACIEPSPAEAFSNATVVFVGEVVFIEPRSLNEQGISLLATQGWHDVDPVVTVASIGSQFCRIQFSVGETYLLFARKSYETGELQVYACGGTGKLAHAKKYLTAFAPPRWRRTVSPDERQLAIQSARKRWKDTVSCPTETRSTQIVLRRKGPAFTIDEELPLTTRDYGLGDECFTFVLQNQAKCNVEIDLSVDVAGEFGVGGVGRNANNITIPSVPFHETLIYYCFDSVPAPAEVVLRAEWRAGSALESR